MTAYRWRQLWRLLTLANARDAARTARVQARADLARAEMSHAKAQRDLVAVIESWLKPPERG